MRDDKARLSSLIEKFRKQNVLVIGDLMLDHYIYGEVERISPEAPVPVVRVSDELNRLGGAANVALNIQSLGGNAFLCGVVGDDAPGRDLLKVMEENSLHAKGVISLPHVRTTVKTRILAGRQQVVRVDHDKGLMLSKDDYSRFCEMAVSQARNVSGIIIEDYGRGAVSQHMVTAVLDEAAKRNIPVALDPKDNFDLNARGIAFATPNRQEAFALAGMSVKPPHENPLEDIPLLAVANSLMLCWQPEFMIITLGAQGMLLMSKEKEPRHIATVAQEVFDVSGAGDTVIAAAVLALLSGADYDDVSRLANYAAGVVVGKVGTAICDGDELRHACQS